MCVCNGICTGVSRAFFSGGVPVQYSRFTNHVNSVLGGHALLSHNVRIMLFVICIFYLFGTPVLLSFS